MPTLATIPLVILFIVLWRWTGGRILSMVAFVSVFTAASALNFGALGVSPWLLVLALGLLVKALSGHVRYRPTPGINYAAVIFLSLFLLYALWAGCVHPILFAGTPIVRTVAEEPLAWGMSNFAQLCYLLAVTVLYIMTLGCSRQDLGEILKWYVRGCIVATCFAFYQLLNALLHVPYPSAILYSNKAHVVYPAYVTNGFWRLNGPFCEASEMAGFLSVGLVLVGWRLVAEGFNLGRMIAALLMLAALLMTLSSVGYICLIYMLCCGAILVSRQIVKRSGLSIPTVMVLLILCCGTVIVLETTPSVALTVSKVVQSVLLDKQLSDSYRSRTATHVAALSTLERTSYLGAGWGSARASGLVYILLATVGSPGLLLFTGFLIALTLPLFKAASLQRRLCVACVRVPENFSISLFGLSILLLAMLIAGSEPVDPLLWLLFGIASAGPTPVCQLVAHAPQVRSRRTRVPIAA